MRIEFVEIKNFRKLVSCHISLSEKETLFVGANNSGKTSAMDAMILFLKKDRNREISITDFTIANWTGINNLGKAWLERTEGEQVGLEEWRPFLPSLDIWLNVEESEIHHVIQLIPTLGWTGGRLGVRLSFEPTNPQNLYSEFRMAIDEAEEAVRGRKRKNKLSLWPQGLLKNFLERRLSDHFTVRAYLLDPAKLSDPEDGIAKPQLLTENSTAIHSEPFKGLFKISDIPAQRGFTDAAAESKGFGSLTVQMRTYFEKHLNPATQSNRDDLRALEAIDSAKRKFDNRLKSSLQSAISELETLGYPGFMDPQIILATKVDPLESLNHDAAVQFNVVKSSSDSSMRLPEKYNGLGYQNLLSNVFKLIRFRDEWMRKGKASRKSDKNSSFIEPLHLVLVEEPEAHLHAQVQQVFIKKAYTVLRNHEDLGEAKTYNTQLVVSTHSSHIAHEIEFGSIRYFRRKSPGVKIDAPHADVVNLSTVFGSQDETAKFVTRYLKATHCDLFFADAAIFVEGASERMLIPHFIRKDFSVLDSLYISTLEIGGSHAFKLRPLIELLGIPTLIITDIDAIEKDSNSKIRPERGQGYRTGNFTLKNWLPCVEAIDSLADLPENRKISENTSIRVAYQTPVSIAFFPEEEVIPSTFEDSLALTNLSLFIAMKKATGLLGKMVVAASNDDTEEILNEMFDSLKGGKKAEMALELLFHKEPKELDTPVYISEGLKWLEERLSRTSEKDQSSEGSEETKVD